MWPRLPVSGCDALFRRCRAHVPTAAAVTTLRITLAFTPIALAFFTLWTGYCSAYAFWDRHTGGQWRWDSVWPKARTRFVLLLVVLPVWGAFMGGVTLLYVAFTRSTCGDRAVRAFACIRSPNTRDHESRVELDPLTSSPERDEEAEDLDHAADSYIKHTRRSSSPNLGLRRRRGRRLWVPAVASWCTLSALGLYLLVTYEQKDDILYRPILRQALDQPRRQGYHTGEKYYIAANMYNNEAIIPRWTQELMKVIDYLGPDNVFVSIYESNSNDQSPQLLRDFSELLLRQGVQRRIIVQDTSISPPYMRQTSHDRIRFLSQVRNKVMEPLYQRGGFDRILFLNDIFYEAESVVELLKTRNGDWDQVCGLDFGTWGLYDAWVIRDRLGALVSSVWPFLFEDSGMNAIISDQPAPVFSCWNGITALRATPFLSPIQRANVSSTHNLSTGTTRPFLPPSHPLHSNHAGSPPADMPALRFRTSSYSTPSECFSSECFLISYDLRRVFLLDKIYVNPRVIVAYEWGFYVWYKWVLRHWIVRWWIENVERGSSYMFTRVTIGPKEHVYNWDGGACFPFS